MTYLYKTLSQKRGFEEFVADACVDFMHHRNPESSTLIESVRNFEITGVTTDHFKSEQFIDYLKELVKSKFPTLYKSLSVDRLQKYKFDVTHVKKLEPVGAGTVCQEVSVTNKLYLLDGRALVQLLGTYFSNTLTKCYPFVFAIEDNCLTVNHVSVESGLEEKQVIVLVLKAVEEILQIYPELTEFCDNLDVVVKDCRVMLEDGELSNSTGFDHNLAPRVFELLARKIGRTVLAWEPDLKNLKVVLAFSDSSVLTDIVFSSYSMSIDKKLKWKEVFMSMNLTVDSAKTILGLDKTNMSLCHFGGIYGPVDGYLPEDIRKYYSWEVPFEVD